MNEVDPLEVCDEVLLWRAVFAQAITDATAQTVARVYSSSVLTVEGRSEARRFLLSQIEPWRGDRHFVCHLSGLCPEQVEERARKILGPIIAWEQAEEARHVETEHERDKRLGLVEHIEAGGTIDSGRRGSKLRKRPNVVKAVQTTPSKPVKVQRWTSQQFFAWAVANADGLEALGELDAAIQEAARRESQSVGQRTRQARDQLVAHTAPALAAE